MNRKIINVALVIAMVVFPSLPLSSAFAGEPEDADMLELQIVFGTSYDYPSLKKAREVYTERRFLQRYTCLIGGKHYFCDVYILLGSTVGFDLVILDGGKVVQVDVIEYGDVKLVWQQ